MIKKLIIVSIITSATLAAVIPNTGDILRQVEPAKVPTLQKKLPNISKEYKTPLEMKDDLKIDIHSFTFSGNSIYSDQLLSSLIKEYQNTQLGINGLKKVTSIITKYYRDHGYFVARAYLPKQSMQNGIVEITIIEGTYGAFDIKNTSLVNTQEVQNFMNKLQGGEVVSTKTLEKQMLLINELSGAKVTNAEVYPGKEVGTSDFRITAEPTNKYNTYIIADNYGSRYTGKNRLNGGITVNSLTGVGDSLNITGLISDTQDLKNIRLGYERALGYTGLKGGVSASITKYELDEIPNYEGYGDTTIFGGYLSYPLIKTRAHTLSTTLNYDHKKMNDTSGVIGNTNESIKKINVVSLSLDDKLNTSISTLPGTLFSSIALNLGKVTLDNNIAKTNDINLNSEGNYAKLNLSIIHNQYLVKELTLLSSLKLQKSFGKNLDSSEDLSVAGSNGVRAYEDSELSGDQGYLASLELSYKLPNIQAYGHNISVFVDHAKIWTNDNRFNTDENTRSLSAVGLGYTLNYKMLDLKTTFAHGIGGDATPTAEAEFSTSKNKLLVQGMMRF